MATNLTYILVVAISFEAIDRFATNFHKIYTMFVLNAQNSYESLRTKIKMSPNLTYILDFAFF